MPYDKPNPDNACENCAGGPVYGGSTHCAGCEFPDPEFVLEAMRKGGMAVHGGRRDACVMQRGEQDAGEFYQQLKLAGRDDG